MARLPKEVRSWIYDFFSKERSAAYLKIDARQCIEAKGGNLGYYGLLSLRTGEPVADQLEIMEGLLPCPELPFHLPMMELPGGRVADLHFFDDSGS
ncbi:adenylate/guanylate cyclase domain-containing protein, partial [Mesorhizobium sp. M4B.F.Ca.ET.019.03.1.1]